MAATGAHGLSRRRDIDDEISDLQGAARYLKCSPRALRNCITKGQFGPDDGLRRFGDLVRIHMPTLRERVKDGTLMKDPKGKNK